MVFDTPHREDVAGYLKTASNTVRVWGEGGGGGMCNTNPDPIMELGSQNHSRDGLLGPNSIIVVYMDPLGKTV